jgi:hypothetical protein
MRQLTLALVALLAATAFASAQPAAPEQPMTLDRMGAILTALDPDAAREGGLFRLTIEGFTVMVVTDVPSDRMRAMISISAAETLDADEMRRLMQANFDSALDARYALANGRLWSVFIHPFAALEKDQLISGIAQTVNVAKTYGTLYSGGALQFGGGDSNDLQHELIERLLKKGVDI